jgi:hypothetical protein
MAVAFAAHRRGVTTKHLWIASALAACTANAASPEPDARSHACAPAAPDDAEPHDVLRIASADGSVDLVVHAWTDRTGAIVDVHTVWQSSIYADDEPSSDVARPDVHVDTETWRLAIVDGVARHELHVVVGDDGEALAFATVVTGDDEPTWCRLRSARLLAPRRGPASLGAGRIEARCEDASGTEVEGWVARTPD